MYRLLKQKADDTKKPMTDEFKELKDEIKALNEYIVEKWEYEKLNLLQDNDECMREHSAVAQYWQAKQALEEIGREIETNL